MSSAMPPNTIHQHFNRKFPAPGSPDFGDQPHLQGMRVERSRAGRGRSRYDPSIVLNAEIVEAYLRGQVAAER